MRTHSFYLNTFHFTLGFIFISAFFFGTVAQEPPPPIPPNEEGIPPIPKPTSADTTELGVIKSIEAVDSMLVIPPDEFDINDDEYYIDYPKQILRKSLVLPGLGQYENDQAWKIPIIYGLLGGLGYYSIYLTKQYHDYRAAYYNAVSPNEDFIFGPTPERLIGANTSQLKANRNYLRNRRDFMYVAIGLAYALNAVDAYVYAHLSSFDVSDDLSIRPIVDWGHSSNYITQTNTMHILDKQYNKVMHTPDQSIENALWNLMVPEIGFSIELKKHK
jgi:hypothetical protein